MSLRVNLFKFADVDRAWKSSCDELKGGQIPESSGRVIRNMEFGKRNESTSECK